MVKTHRTLRSVRPEPWSFRAGAMVNRGYVMVRPGGVFSCNVTK